MKGAITAPGGFRAAGVAAGIKQDAPDLALLVAEATCAAAAVFTTNRAQAAPVLVSREHVAAGRARAVIVNSGCANAATGAPGLEDAREMAALTARGVGCPAGEVLVASTGVIGVRLPMEKVRAAIPRAAAALSLEGGADAARAIMTTDTRPKEVLVEFTVGGRAARLGGMAKGAGMIAPHMATMLAFLTTDASVAPAVLQSALAQAAELSFNRITVDGDTSTNDTAVILASGACGAPSIERPGPDLDAFRAALNDACQRLALMLIRDGEGTTRVAEVRVEGAQSPDDAVRVARTVAESPLVKTALYGGDANWGRILGAVGRAGVKLDIDRVDIFLGEVWVCEAGAAREYDESLATDAFTRDTVLIRVRLNAGAESASIWTCDLSHGYVDINGSYRS
jgi:glutamate N-acetyltransferase / amino-acid N-acetyltransferase